MTSEKIGNALWGRTMPKFVLGHETNSAARGGKMFKPPFALNVDELLFKY